ENSLFVPNSGGQSTWTLTIGPNVTVHGGTTGYVGYDPNLPGAGGGPITSSVINQGTIDADTSGGTIYVNGTNWSNTGTLKAENTGTLNLLGAWTNSGTVASNGGQVNINSSALTNSGTISLVGGTMN